MILDLLLIDCKSWVYKIFSMECYLKSVLSLETVECNDCVAYKPMIVIKPYDSPVRMASSVMYSLAPPPSTALIERDTLDESSEDVESIADSKRRPTGSAIPRDPFKLENSDKDRHDNVFPYCRSIAGYDQPSEFDIEGSPLKAKTVDHCCSLCAKHIGKILFKNRRKFFLFVDCVFWVWKANSESCYLKREYDMRREFGCDDCVAYNPSNNHVSEEEVLAFSDDLTDQPLKEKISFETENTIVWRNEVSCSHTKSNYDYPGNDLFDEPLEFIFTDSDCCDACNDHGTRKVHSSFCFQLSIGCQSWVYNRHTMECYLKTVRNSYRNAVERAYCIASDLESVSRFSSTQGIFSQLLLIKTKCHRDNTKNIFRTNSNRSGSNSNPQSRRGRKERC